jgi:hypothetical protein
MEYALCSVSAAAVRSKPDHRSEMTNQLLFGETVLILESKEEWYKIRSLYDDYEGWVTHHMFENIDEKTALGPLPFVSTGLLNPVTLPDQLVNLPMGSSLTGFDVETRLLWDGLHKYHGTYRNVQQSFNTDLLWQVIHLWINAPYLWGGRTFLGVDCSGFVQVVFKVLGIRLLRDAYQQAEQGNPIQSFEKLSVGDLAFFHNAKGKIIHVGIVLTDQKIIHASGKVRIDKLDEKGIIRRENGKRTHELHSMRRYF